MLRSTGRGPGDSDSNAAILSATDSNKSAMGRLPLTGCFQARLLPPGRSTLAGRDTVTRTLRPGLSWHWPPAPTRGREAVRRGTEHDTGVEPPRRLQRRWSRWELGTHERFARGGVRLSAGAGGYFHEGRDHRTPWNAQKAVVAGARRDMKGGRDTTRAACPRTSRERVTEEQRYSRFPSPLREKRLRSASSLAGAQFL